jgi:putative transposase
MRAGKFARGAVVKMEGRIFTLLRKTSDDVWQLEDAQTGRIEERTDGQLRESYVAGSLVFRDKTSVPETLGAVNTLRLLDEPDSPSFMAAKLRRSYVKALGNRPGSRNIADPIIRETWEALGRPGRCPDFSTVLRWRKRFSESGGDFSSLVESTAKKGNRKDRFPAEVVALVSEAVDAVFMKPERGSIQDTLDAAKIAVRRENRLLPPQAALPMPTRRLVKRLIMEIPAFDRHLARYGRDSAHNAFRAVTGFKAVGAPLERAEMDHTPLDLFVVDDDTGMPMGRPYLTTCIDCHSRSVLGCVVGFEPPSYLTVAQCLKHMFLPKTDLRAKHPVLKNDWHAYGIPEELVVDNGSEFHSESLEKACLHFGTEIHYAPRKTGAFKGKIERFQKTMNDAVARGVPGTTFSDIFEKEDYDPAKQAVIGFRRFKEILNIWIVDVYHQKPHRALGASPAAAWALSINPEDIAVPADPAAIDALLGRVETGRRLSHKGVELDGLFYNSSELTEVRRRHGSLLTVDLRVDDANLGRLAVIVPGGKHFVFAKAVHEAYAEGLSRWQHRVCRRFAKMTERPEDPDSWLDAKEEIARLISEEFLRKRHRGNKRAARFQTGGTAPEGAVAVPAAPALTDHLTDSAQQDPAGDVRIRPRRPPGAVKRFSPIPSVRAKREVVLDNPEPTND